MTGTITYILSRAGWRAMNGPLADERRRLAGAEPPAAYVSYDPRLLSGAGWYGYRIALKGGYRSMVERARYMLSERYVIRDGYEYYADGVYVFGVLLRERVLHYGIGGGAEPEPPTIDWWGLKLTMPEGGTVILRKNGNPNAVSLEVSTDGQNWQPWTLVGTDYSYTLEEGQTLCVRNTSTTFVRLSTGTSNYYNFVFDSTVEASGSIMSLSVNDETVLSLAGASYNFCYLFRGCTSLVNAPILPATTLTEGCYYYMFQGCTNLVNAPDLPATTLYSYCYYYMFQGCTSLVNAPDLPATTLASRCYYSMFQGCTSLVNAPDLPATTLTEGCYYSMFQGCTSLVNAPDLPATTLASYCYVYMFQGCTSLVNAPDLPATTLASYCYYSMFQGCTSLVNAPILPATTLASYCYYSMFQGCTSLVNAPDLPATTLTEGCYSYMFQGCTSLVNAPDLPATTLTEGCYSYMFQRCTTLSEIRTHATDISASNCLTNWLSGVAVAGDFYCDPNLTIPTGSSGIPSGWTRHDI